MFFLLPSSSSSSFFFLNTISLCLCRPFTSSSSPGFFFYLFHLRGAVTFLRIKVSPLCHLSQQTATSRKAAKKQKTRNFVELHAEKATSTNCSHQNNDHRHRFHLIRVTHRACMTPERPLALAFCVSIGCRREKSLDAL